MSIGWKVLVVAALAFAVAFVMARLLVPDVVAIGYADEPQPSWAVMTAFALRAIELTAAWVAAIALLVMSGAWVRRRLRHALNSRPT